MLGMGAVCLLLEAEKGVIAVLVVLFYPLYCLAVLTVWSEVGTYFEGIAGGLNQALYDCAWVEMPLSTRKMMVIMMAFGQKAPSMECLPFYAANRESFAGVAMDQKDICHSTSQTYCSLSADTEEDLLVHGPRLQLY